MLEAWIFKYAPSAIVDFAAQRGITGIAVFRNLLAPLQDALGVSLPATPLRVTVRGVIYLWSGPGSWLAVSNLEPDFSAAAAFAAITDQSDGRVVLRVHGPHARDVLAKLVPIDLHPSVFQPNATALTLAGHIAVQIWQADDGAFELACFRSFAEALYQSLVEAGREFEVDRPGRG